MLFEKFGPKPLGVYPPRAGGQKTLFWNRRRILTENIYATKHDINHRKETRQSTETPLPRTSCRLTFVIHFGLIIFARWSLCSSQMPRAWIALVRLRAGRAHAGLCHASSCFYFFLLISIIFMRRVASKMNVNFLWQPATARSFGKSIISLHS